MPIDPNTGIYTVEPSLQPTGALGAVTNLLNAQRAREIADTLQQQREAQAWHEQQQAEEYQAATERASQARAAQAALPPGTPWQKRIEAALPFENFKDVLPVARATVAAGGKVEGARIQAYTKAFDTLASKGMAPQDAIDFLDRNPMYVDQFEDVAPPPAPASAAKPLPVAEKTAENLGAGATLKTEQATDIKATRPYREKLYTAKTELTKMRKQLEAKKGTLTKSEASVANQRLKVLDSTIYNLSHDIFKESKEVDPADQQTYQQAVEEREAIRKLLDAALQKNMGEPPAKPYSGVGSYTPFAGLSEPQGSAPPPATAAQASIPPPAPTTPAPTPTPTLRWNPDTKKIEG